MEAISEYRVEWVHVTTGEKKSTTVFAVNSDAALQYVKKGLSLDIRTDRYLRARKVKGEVNGLNERARSNVLRMDQAERARN